MEIDNGTLGIIATSLVALFVGSAKWFYNHITKIEGKLSKCIDEVEEDHTTLDKLIAREYMSTDKTMAMYDLMARAQDQRMQDMNVKLNKIDTKLDTLLMAKVNYLDDKK